MNQKLMKSADRAYGRTDFMRAYALYASLLKQDSLNDKAMYKSGLCLFNMNKTDEKALNYFIKTKSKIPESHFYIAKMWHMQGKSEQALEELYYYKGINKKRTIGAKEIDALLQKCENAIKESAQKENYLVKNIGPVINTEYSEYVPLIWNRNGSLVFTSRRPGSKGGLMDAYGKYYEDIYISDNVDGNWTKPVSLSDSLNTETHDACVAFSPKGDELIIYRTDEQKTGGDLYTSRYEGTNWTKPVKMGEEVNSEFLETSACYSSSENIIIFSSNRPGGYGGRDLYRVVRFLNGKYSTVTNLGPLINTEEDEDAPFMDENDNTLYFSSKGHNGMGEYDVFKADYNELTGNWNNAVNMGQPMNSANDDIYFVKKPGKNAGYFASRREGGFGDADIYEFNFSESSKVVVYYTLSDTHIDKDKLVDLKISMYNLKTGILEGLYFPNKEYMKGILVATKDENYELKIEGTGIRKFEKRITFSEENNTITLDLVRDLE